MPDGVGGPDVRLISERLLLGVVRHVCVTRLGLGLRLQQVYACDWDLILPQRYFSSSSNLH